MCHVRLEGILWGTMGTQIQKSVHASQIVSHPAGIYRRQHCDSAGFWSPITFWLLYKSCVLQIDYKPTISQMEEDLTLSIY